MYKITGDIIVKRLEASSNWMLDNLIWIYHGSDDKYFIIIDNDQVRFYKGIQIIGQYYFYNKDLPWKLDLFIKKPETFLSMLEYNKTIAAIEELD